MSQKNEKNNQQLPEIPPCYRPDGSFDARAFFIAPQVVSGIISILLGIAISIVITTVVDIESSMVNMLLMILCCVFCVSGCDGILKYLNAQRAARDQRKH